VKNVSCSFNSFLQWLILLVDPPFIEQNQRELFRKIRKGQYEFHEEYWGAVSKDAKNLIASLLTVDPAKRLSAKEALSHKWMLADGKKLAAQDLGKNLDEFKKYNARRKFKGAVKAVSIVSEVLGCLVLTCIKCLTLLFAYSSHRS
jgi:calcium/calmodulin-dependent protein kinase (CaM kinase) II/calcium/calmodulin-dependent protein kinase I